MNAFVGSGRVVRNAVVRSDKVKLIKFTIVAKHGYDHEKKRDRVSFIPCVLFNPTEAMENLLAREGKGVFVEFEGRVSTSKVDSGNGKSKYNTEIIVNPRTFNILMA